MTRHSYEVFYMDGRREVFGDHPTRGEYDISFSPDMVVLTSSETELWEKGDIMIPTHRIKYIKVI